MPLYQYTAMDSNGKEQKGKKEAGSEEEVATFLKNQGLFPTSIKSAAKGAEAPKPARAEEPAKAAKAADSI
ncbi:MAG: hypothetical protein V8T87_16245 [Victivallales bacterium]